MQKNTGEDFLDQIKDKDIFEQFDFLKSTNNSVSTSDEWGEQIDFSVEEILDIPTVCEVQSEGDKNVLSQEEAWELFA